MISRSSRGRPPQTGSRTGSRSILEPDSQDVTGDVQLEALGASVRVRLTPSVFSGMPWCHAEDAPQHGQRCQRHDADRSHDRPSGIVTSEVGEERGDQDRQTGQFKPDQLPHGGAVAEPVVAEQEDTTEANCREEECEVQERGPDWSEPPTPWRW